MKKRHKKAFTLLEVLVTLLIAGIISLIGIPGLLTQIKNFQVKEDILKVEQAVKEARSTAINRSRTCLLDFSQGTTEHGSNGGLIQVKESDGTVLSQLYLSRNVLFNSSASTIANNEIRFDFRGQPVDSTGVASGFTTSTNTITISFYKGSTPAVSKSFTITPYTGYIETP